MKTPTSIKFHLRGQGNGGVFLAIVIFCVVGFIFGEIFSGGSSGSSGNNLDSATQKAREGRASDMTNAEMNAFRREQQNVSEANKQRITSQLTPEEKALRDYEDEMVLKGETQSNPYYEELQRKASESRN